MPTTRVVILAAGKGTRMKSDIPKPLIIVAGEPMVRRLVRSVQESGVDRHPIVVVSPSGEDQFRRVLGSSVQYAVQKEQLGTGHAVKVAKDFVKDAERIIVLYGDHPFIRPEVIRDIAALQEKNKNSLVLLTTKVPNFDNEFEIFSRWGRILRDSSGKVVAIREMKDATPKEREVREVNPAIFAFPAEWAWKTLDRLRNVNANSEYYLTDLAAAAMEDGKVIITAEAEPFDVVGINSPEELCRVEELRKKVNLL